MKSKPNARIYHAAGRETGYQKAHKLANEELAVQRQKLVDLLKAIMPEQPREVDFLSQISNLA
ncbi:MAG: hypothetical protein R3C11_22965 [Planctomycetaceae bacterium]